MANCGFESGDFTAWIEMDMADPFDPLHVGTAGETPGFNFFTSAPTEGTMAALHGFDGGGPDTIEIAQDIFLPLWARELRFDYRGAWDMESFPGSTLPRTFDVTVQPLGGGAPLQTTNVLSAAPGTSQFDTGNRSAVVDLGPFINTNLRFSFDWLIPENFTGPGFFQLDNVTLQPPRIVCGTTTAGAILPGNDVQWYRINLGNPAADQLMRFDIDAAIDGSTLDPVLGIFDQSVSFVSTGTAFPNPSDDLPAPGEPPTLDPYIEAIMGNGNPARTHLEYLVAVSDFNDFDFDGVGDAGSGLDYSGPFRLTVECSLEAPHTNDTALSGTPSNDGTGPASWHFSSSCPANTAAGHSAPGAARWGDPADCSSYSASAASLDVLNEFFQVAAIDNGLPVCAPGAYRQLMFNYFLDFQETSEFDRARVAVSTDGGTPVVLLDNGLGGGNPGLGGLADTGAWESVSIALPAGGPASPETYEIQFIGQIDDVIANAGEGFLVDDVRIECLSSSIFTDGFESGDFAAWSGAVP